jgi:hypothetical protein
MTVVAAISVVALLSPEVAGSATPRSINVQVLRGPVQLGINIRWSYFSESESKLQSQIATSLNYIKSLGANSVAIEWNFYTTSATSNSVAAGTDTPTPAVLGEFLSDAKAQGLFVLVRPLLAETNPSQPWRGKIQPTNRNLWFKNYEKFMRPYLTISQQDHANEFAFSGELESMGSDRRWRTTFLPWATKIYKNALMFNVAWEQPGMAPIPGRTYGVDMYRPLNLGPSATVPQLLAGWNSWLTRIRFQTPLRDIYIVEVGIAAQGGAYTHPSLANFHTPIIPAVQSKWFQAACEFFREHKFRSLYFYSTSLTAGPQLKQIGGVPQDFQGMSPPVIKSCFAGS